MADQMSSEYQHYAEQEGHSASMEHEDHSALWYFNTLTNKPELGMKSPASHRMGPYHSREEALRAYDIVRERNRAWEQQDMQWGSQQ